MLVIRKLEKQKKTFFHMLKNRGEISSGISFSMPVFFGLPAASLINSSKIFPFHNFVKNRLVYLKADIALLLERRAFDLSRKPTR